MRLHTDVLTREQIETIVAETGQGIIGIGGLTEHRSRTADHAFELRLSGTSITGGAYGTASYTTATWDEWGIILDKLYRIDPNMVVGPSFERAIYEDRRHFQRVTYWRYDTLTLEERCPRHKWDWYMGDGECVKCGAQVNKWAGR